MERIEEIIDDYLLNIQEKFSNWWDVGINYSPPSAKELLDKIKDQGYKFSKDD